MKICGIIIAKENSNRFKGKNYSFVDGKPMFFHSIDLLINSGIDKKDIYVATDSDDIKKYCILGHIKFIDRKINISRDEEPFFNVLKFAYQCLDKRYDVIVSVLANSIDHSSGSIQDGLNLFEKDPHIEEIRSFDESGFQSGIFIFKESVFIKDYMILNHSAAIKSNGKEIHYKKELNDERTKMA